MDENVVYNSPTQDGASNPTDQETATDETATEETDQAVTDDQTDGTGEEGSDEEPPPPVGFFSSGLLKKVLIGLGVLVLLIIIVILLIPKAQQAQPVTLQWWGLWEDASTMQPLIDDFEKTHPNITIDYVKESPSLYNETLLTRIPAGNGPDIFLFHNTWLPMYSGDLSPLPTSVITPDAFKQAYYPVMQQDLTSNGAIYGIPLDADSLALYVNPQLLAAAGVSVPTNWNDFLKAALKLTQTTNGSIKVAGAALGTYDNINHAPDIISLLFLQDGAQMNNFTATAQNETDALTYYTLFVTGQNPTWDDTQPTSLTAFCEGRLAMYFGFSWDVFSMQQLCPTLQFKIYPVPSLTNSGAPTIRTTVASYWVEGVSAKSLYQKQDMEFMQYLAQKSTAEEFYTETAKSRSFGEPYARKDLQQSLAGNPLVYPFVSQLDDAQSSFFASDTSDGENGINTLMNAYLQTAINSIIPPQDNSPASAVQDLDSGVAQVLQKYGSQQ